MQAWEAFDGVWERIRRARTHREAAAREWASWLSEYEPYGPWLDVDDNGNGTLLVRQFSPVAPIIAIELGEWLYNLRAALDYTAYALAIYNTKSDPPPDEAAIQFPIYDTPTQFANHQRCIQPLAEKHRRWIEAMQPYSYNAVPGQTAMYWVNHLARIDRHRKLQVVGGYISESSPIVTFGADEGAIFFEDVDPIVFIEPRDDGEGEAVIARFKVVPPALRDKVEANPQTAVEPDILEMVRQRPPEIAWLRYPLSKRLFMIEAIVDANIGLFENDCFGWTRSQYFKKSDGVDPDGVEVGGEPGHDAAPDS
jgi:hypothetical protein